MNIIKNTLLHEIAHAIAGQEHHHDKVWKKIALSIGCNGERCSKSGFSQKLESRFVKRCKKGCFSRGMHRLPRIDGRTCKACGSKLQVLCDGQPCKGAKVKTKCWALKCKSCPWKRKMSRRMRLDNKRCPKCSSHLELSRSKRRRVQ